ncbi:MAG: hypothetical protein ACKOSS_08885 [Planctomycetia bacterium]
MRGVTALPWLLLALATGVLGFVLGRGTGDPQAAATPPLPAAAVRDEAPDGAAPAAGPGPTLASAPQATSERPAGPAGAAGPGRIAPPAAPQAAGPVPTPPDPPVDPFTLLEGADGTGRVAGPSTPSDDPDARALQELIAQLRAQPEAAARQVEVLLASLRASARPLHLALAERVRAEQAPRDDREGVLRALARQKGRDWAPEQMTGPPDTLRAGDLPTAWASQAADCGDVWVECDFATAVVPERLRVHETCAPGAITQAWLWQGEPGDPDGRWVQAWAGEAPVAEPPAWHEIPLTLALRTRSVRLVVATSRIAGWNEIAAVELVAPGLRQWAAAARAGSSYGQ